MPNDPTAEQVELRRKGRQRLIGAVVLALVAVVFVPMLLDPEPRRERVTTALEIPAKEGAPPLVAAPKGPEPAPQPEVAKAAPAQAVTPDFKPTAPSAASTQTQAAPALSTPVLQGFAVQVGAFKDETKLAQAREKIAATRLAHYTERIDGASGELTRLRVGPFPTRELAEKAAARLKHAGLDARVMTLP